MKRLQTLFGALMILAAVSCNKNQQAGEGQVSFEVRSIDTVADVTRSNVSDYTTLPAADAFSIKITDASSQTVYEGKIMDWVSADNTLKSGGYSVTAECGKVEDEGFDKPYFIGNQTFTVNGGETSEVSIPVSLGNTIVMVECTEGFRNYYKDWSFKLTRNGADIVAFAKDETKAAFVDGYRFTLSGVMEAETKTYTFNKEYSSLEPATAYTFVFDVTNAGSAAITISFNNKVETVELGDIELND